MIILIGTKTSSRFIEIWVLLDKLSLSYQMKYTMDYPFIQEEIVQCRGDEEIGKRILDLENELKSGHYCPV